MSGAQKALPQGWSATVERGHARWLAAMLWVALHLGARVGEALLLPVTAWFLASSPGARAASAEYLGRVLGRKAGLWQVARHFHAFASAVLDRVFLLARPDCGFRIDVEGASHVTELLASGRGCLLMGAHLGSFEALRALSRLSPVPVRALMYRRNAGALTALLDRLSPSLRDSVIEIGDSASMLQVREAVARGEIVGILADRTPSGQRQVAAPFLGATAWFPAGPFVLASMLDAPVVLFRAVRLGRRHYAVRFEPFAARVVLARATRAADLAAVVGRYAAAIEAGCRAHPYQWFNFFPFWEPGDAAETDATRPAAGAGPAAGGGG